MANIMRRTLVFFTILFVYYVIQTPMNFWFLTKRQFFTLLIMSIIIWYFIVKKYFSKEHIIVRVLIDIVITVLLCDPVLRWITPFVVKLLKNKYIICGVFVGSLIILQSMVMNGPGVPIIIAILSCTVSFLVLALMYFNKTIDGNNDNLKMSSPFLNNPLLAILFTVYVTWSIMWLIHRSTFLV